MGTVNNPITHIPFFFFFQAQTTPFQIDVKFDDNEDLAGGEQLTPDGGIVGFHLDFQQISC